MAGDGCGQTAWSTFSMVPFERINRKISSIFRNMPVGVGFVYLVKRYFIEKLYPVYFVFTLSDPKEYGEGGQSSFDVKTVSSKNELSNHEISLLERKSTYSNLDEFERSFKRGSRLYLCMQFNEIVGYCWVSQNGSHHFNVSCNAYYIYDVEVFYDSRQKGCGKRFVQDVCICLRNADSEKPIWCAIHVTNTPSIKMFKSVGFKGVYTCRKVSAPPPQKRMCN